MNYIYDIVLNFQDNYYDFYEWLRQDKIKNIKKLPLYHISDKDLLTLKNNQVQITKDILSQIKKDNPKFPNPLCLVSNTSLTIGLLFDNNGHLLKRSSLLFDEEDEANALASTLPLTKFTYTSNIPVTPLLKLRVELEKKDALIRYIKQNTNPLILKYLYYEYYQKECTNTTQIKKLLLTELEKDWNLKQNNLYQLINLLPPNLPTK